MTNHLFALMDSFANQKVLVIGEAMLDRYLKGSTTRLSQEAPVQVVSVEEKEDIPGGAANTAANLRSLGAEPIFLSVIGDDEEGKMLRQALCNFDISDEHIFSSPIRQTLAKQRVMANGQMMIRFDQGSTTPLDPQSEEHLIERIDALADLASAVVISDYSYGILTPRVLHALKAVQEKNPRVLVVDAKQFRLYRSLRVTAVKPNYGEACKLLRLEPVDGEERVAQIEKHGQRILEIANAQIAAVTLDQDGALIFERDQPFYRIYARPADHNRVAGAGDTFISALTLALAAGVPTSTAAEIASTAAAIVVEKPGTSTCYLEELKGYFGGDDVYITDSFHMAARVAAYRRQGKRIVFTNGCFDILHSGHIQYLNQAKAHGDVLIVGINTDRSVKRLKGPGRPINSLEDRAQVLSALSCIDHIIPFDENIPFSLIRLIQPDVFIKGGDYTRQTLPEAELVEELGGTVMILPYVQDHSTSGIIERIRQTSVKETQRVQAAKSTGRKEREKLKQSSILNQRPGKAARGTTNKHPAEKDPHAKRGLNKARPAPKNGAPRANAQASSQTDAQETVKIP